MLLCLLWVESHLCHSVAAIQDPLQLKCPYDNDTLLLHVSYCVGDVSQWSALHCCQLHCWSSVLWQLPAVSC